MDIFYLLDKIYVHKRAVAAKPHLKLPDFSYQFIIPDNASSEAIGNVLQPWTKPVRFFNKVILTFGDRFSAF